MSHYEERLQQDIDGLQSKVHELGQAVGGAFGNAIRALLQHDENLATEVVVGDLAINRLSRDLDRKCHGFVARHLPSAGHLRFVSSVMRLSIILERVGDYAETISKTVLQLSEAPSDLIGRDLQLMGDQSISLYEQAIKTFTDGNAEGAETTRQMASHFTKSFDSIFKNLVKEGDDSKRPTAELFALLACFNRIERVIHQSKNICEETIFAVTGSIKSRKKFDILFFDKTNSGTSIMAQAMVKRSYPESGRTFSAGSNPTGSLNPEFESFCSERGLDLTGFASQSLSDLDLDYRLYDIVIVFDQESRATLPKPGFHTIVLECPIDAGMDPSKVFEQLTPFFSDLMLKLRGEDWD